VAHFLWPRPGAIPSASPLVPTLGITFDDLLLAEAQETHPVQSKPRALIFDFFGVVAQFDESILYRKIASECRKPELAYRTLHGLPSTPSLIEGRTTLEQVHERLVSELGFGASFQSFHQIWLEPYSSPMPDFAPLLGALRDRYRLVLLSNVDRYYFEAIRHLHPELRHFDVQLVSFEMGYSKPSEQAFHTAIAAAEAPECECFFVDDKAENIAAAMRLGITGHIFTSTQGCRQALASVGVMVR
jgi:putative hydrolase of the HAD superfamily